MPRSKKLSKKRSSVHAPFVIERKETKRNKSIVKEQETIRIETTYFTGNGGDQTENIIQTEEMHPEEEIDPTQIEEIEVQKWKSRVRLWASELKFSLKKGLTQFE